MIKLTRKTEQRIDIFDSATAQVVGSYVLREMTTEARDRYLDENRATMKLNSDGSPSQDWKVQGFKANLLKRCVFHLDGRAVTEQEVNGWPAGETDDIFIAARDMNGLKPEAEKSPDEKKS